MHLDASDATDALRMRGFDSIHFAKLWKLHLTHSWSVKCTVFSPSFRSLGVFGVLGRGKVGKGWLVLKLNVLLSGCLLKNSNTSTFWKGEL